MDNGFDFDEEANKTLDEVEATFDYIDTDLYDLIPDCIKGQLELFELLKKEAKY